MEQQEKIVLWIDRRWLTAIEKHLNGQTLQEHMEDVLDELCNQLPEREYTRISKAIQAGSSAAREREEAAQTWSAYRVLENGEEWCFKVAPGEELLNAAERLNRYLNTSADTGSKFIRLFSCGTLLTSGEYQQMIAERMENTGKVTGVFELDFDKREFSAVHIMDGWRTWAMRDVSAAVYHATRSQFASSDDKWRKLLDHLSGKEITSAGHLSARNFSFGDEIIESDGKLNFYVQTEFDVDAAFGTFVLTDENDDWLNVYANYDIAQGKPCDTLELTLCKGDGSEESWSYQLNAAEQDVLLRKMEEYCQQQTGMSLHDYAQQFREEPEQQGAGDEAVGTNADTARLKHSRLRKQQRPGCACLRARGAAELRQPALGGQPQFGGCYSAPAVFLRSEFESVLRRFLCLQMCRAGRLPISPHRSPCVPLCARLRAGVECVLAKAY